MSEQLKSAASTTAEKAAPWRKDIAWWLLVIEGAILLILGIYLLVATVEALVLLARLITIVLAAAGVLHLVSGLRRKADDPSRTLELALGAIGAVAGGLILILLLFNALSLDAGRWLLALGSLAFGVVGIYRVYNGREGGLGSGTLISSAFFTFVGAILFWVSLTGSSVLRTGSQAIAVAALLAGLALVVVGLMRRGKRKAV